jgi:hypothetical protein
MSVRGFGSLVMATSVAGAALGCYLVSLNVASERAELESVEARIVTTQRQIRTLQTEIGTRGRLAQLERWNANFIRLSAPSADQILEGSFQLATMVRPPARHAIDAPVVLASAPVQTEKTPRIVDDSQDAVAAVTAVKPRTVRPDELLHVAGYEVPVRQTAAIEKPVKPKATTAKPTAKRAAASGTKHAAADPLAPLPAAKAAAKGRASGGSTDKPATSTIKDNGSAQ